MSKLDDLTNHPLFIDHENADDELDLRGSTDRETALAIFNDTLDRNFKDGLNNWLVRFDPVKPGAGETLFQPIARLIIESKKQGVISHSYPVNEPDSGGFYIVFKRETVQ